MEKVTLHAKKREETGKIAVRKIRKEGLIPAVCYKDGKKAINLKVKVRDLYDALHTKAGGNVLIALKITGEKSDKTVILKEMQSDALHGDVIHVDFNEISLTKEIKVKVPVTTHGEAKEVTKEGGVIEHIVWEIDVECMPTSIPEKFEIEIAEMKIGDSVQVKDLKVPEGVKVLNDAELVVLTAKPPAKEEVVEEVPGEEEAAEPEIIAKGKKPEEEEVVEEGAPPPKEAKKEAKKETKKEG